MEVRNASNNLSFLAIHIIKLQFIKTKCEFSKSVSRFLGQSYANYGPIDGFRKFLSFSAVSISFQSTFYTKSRLHLFAQLQHFCFQTSWPRKVTKLENVNYVSLWHIGRCWKVFIAIDALKS